jgi:hypothetical protein
LQGTSGPNPEIWQFQILVRSKSTKPRNGLGILHGRLKIVLIIDVAAIVFLILLLVAQFAK